MVESNALAEPCECEDCDGSCRPVEKVVVQCDPVNCEILKQVANDTAEQVVDRTLIAIGIDVRDPLQAQETSAAMRKIAKQAPHIEAMVKHFKDPKTVEAIQFAKKAHGAYTSTRNRVAAAGTAAIFTLWITGITEKARNLFSF